MCVENLSLIIIFSPIGNSKIRKRISSFFLISIFILGAFDSEKIRMIIHNHNA